MSSDDVRDARRFWDGVAPDWQIQVGAEGDSNRRLNSDPVLWRFAGEVAGLSVLDAGCGTGYLTAKLAQRGAVPVGVDFSTSMVELARGAHPDLDFRVDSISHLYSLADKTIDLIVSNYVLMDTPELEEAVSSFYRVLRPGGVAVLIFSHPCFPAGQSTSPDDPTRIAYHWNHSYFERRRRVDPAWGHFTEDFVWFHRPLSDY
ncbi:MAG: class I SAM-dependent methyltransferase, partial [Gemmatimonadetes bacterium]|nr:class I SAM-dependent methyltransferase [Gemmatimonadota bacterium]